MSLVEHLEKHLGRLSGGWKDSNVENLIRVVCFEDQPFENITTYTTLGLSVFELSMASGSKIRQELIFSADRKFGREQVASFLSTFAESIVVSGKALLRGDVIGPSAPIIMNTSLNSVYSAIPMVFPDSFATFEGTLPVTIFPWVIPIYEEEASYARANGWSRFEELLEGEDPDLWDLNRKSVIRLPRP